jgi:hypothetical protein
MVMGVTLLLAFIGMSWFAYQVSLVPQPQSFKPNWQGAQWVQAVDSNQPVSYFRYASSFNVQPDGAFVTVMANQVFRLYVNGYYIGSNASDFVRGKNIRARMFDVNTAIQPGPNVIGIRVANIDGKTPQVRATFGARWGDTVRYYGSGSGWLATGNSALVYPRLNKFNIWTSPLFQATGWQPAQTVVRATADPDLAVSPAVYEQGLPQHWLSSGGSIESYFVRQVVIPSDSTQTLLRVIATGETDIFINDHLYMIWNDQVAVPQINVINYLDSEETVVNYRKGLVMGVYDITPYLHSGANTIALHVLSPGTSTAKVGLDTYKSAVSLDMLSGHGDTYTNLLASDDGWHASPTPVANWTSANSAAFAWGPPTPVGRPGENSTSYLPDSTTPLNEQVVPPAVIGEMLGECLFVLLGFWLAFGLLALRRFYDTRQRALEAACLVFLPALAVECLLLILSRETLMPDPFPYTRMWELALVAITLLSALGLWFHARRANSMRSALARHEMASLVEMHDELLVPESREMRRASCVVAPTFWGRLRDLLLAHWAILPVILLSIPMIAYGLGYEPYWQDEISSYNAAHGILLHGYPIFTSGFVYPKAELFSYAMAAWMFLFGTANPMPRVISMFEYILGVPILYAIGCAMFNRRVGWLAAAMLAFSPYALEWGRQARMYEQAEFMTAILLFVFYWALCNRHLARAPYLAVLVLLLAYFSHEETFVIMPGLLLCVFWISRAGPSGMPDVLRRKHWWYAALIAIVVISTQLSIVFITHPPHLGGDQSQRPQIQITTDNIPYYFNLLFGSKEVKDGTSPGILMQAWIMVNSVLAVIGCAWAFLRKERSAIYVALFQIVAIFTLVIVFTMEADRYFYPQMSAFYLMSAYGFYKLLLLFWTFARPHLILPSMVAHGRRLLPGRLSLPLRGVAMCVGALLTLTVLLAPAIPLSNYNLFISRVTGLSYHRHFADYDDVGNYMRNRLRPGDVVVSLAPSISVQYYVGRVDDYFSIDRALFLIEKDGALLETSSGAHPFLNQADFQAVLSQYTRVWFISDNGGYQAGVTKNGRFNFPPPDFRLVFEGYQASVYFRSADGG